MCDGLVVSALDCKSRGQGFKSLLGQKIGLRFLLHLRPLASSVMMNTLSVGRWEGKADNWDKEDDKWAKDEYNTIM